MPHSHDHVSHSHAPASFGAAFAIGMVLNGLYIVGQVVFGLHANSVALLADAAHNFGDVLGLGAAWIAAVLARRPSTKQYTYGLRGSTWLAALFNATVLMVAIGGIAWEAILRLAHPVAVTAPIIIWVAAIGIVINGVTALLFMSGTKSDLNIRAAFQHMAFDALAALGVLIAGVIILLTGRVWIDPVVSLLVVALTLGSSWALLKDSLNLAMAAVPPAIDLSEIDGFLRGLPGVALHDLDVWGTSTTEIALTVHLVIPSTGNPDPFLAALATDLHDRFGIEHATVQVECGDPDQICPLAPTTPITPA